MGSLKILRYIMVVISPGSGYIKNPGHLYWVNALLKWYLQKSWIVDPCLKTNPRTAGRAGLDRRFLQTEPSKRTSSFPGFDLRVPMHAGYCRDYAGHIRFQPYGKHRIFSSHPLQEVSW